MTRSPRRAIRVSTMQVRCKSGAVACCKTSIVVMPVRSWAFREAGPRAGQRLACRCLLQGREGRRACSHPSPREDLVAWRHQGKVCLWQDLCIHRGAQLSKGWIVEGTVVCPYHGGATTATQMRADPGASGHAAAAEGESLCAAGGGALRLHLGLARRAPARRAAFPEWERDGFRSFTPAPIGSAPMRSARSRISSMPRTFPLCMRV